MTTGTSCTRSHPSLKRGPCPKCAHLSKSIPQNPETKMALPYPKRAHTAASRLWFPPSVVDHTSVIFITHSQASVERCERMPLITLPWHSCPNPERQFQLDRPRLLRASSSERNTLCGPHCTNPFETLKLLEGILFATSTACPLPRL